MLGRQYHVNFRPSVNLLLTHDGCNSTSCPVSLHNTGLLSASLPSSLSPKPSGLAYCLGLEAGQNIRRSPLDSVSTSQELQYGPSKSPRYMAEYHSPSSSYLLLMQQLRLRVGFAINTLSTSMNSISPGAASAIDDFTRKMAPQIYLWTLKER